MSMMNFAIGLDALPQYRLGQERSELAEATIDVDLGISEVWRGRGDQRWRIIACRGGTIWVTQKVDLTDYVLREGEIFVVTLPGPVLVQALEEASVTITPPIKAMPYTGEYHAFR